MKTFGVTIALGAFLLFLVQPLISKILLPWYGGSAAVWTTCMLFFQTMLLLGYYYAYVVTTRLAPRRQAVLHLVMLVIATVASVALFPPDVSWRPGVGESSPHGAILLTLTVTLGLPFCLLAANSPLLQAWYSRVKPEGTSPYRLYSLSNLGSLLGLLIFPFVLEPLLPSASQATLWMVLFGAYVLVTALSALPLLRERHAAPTEVEPESLAPTPPEALPGMGVIAYWLVLAAAGSVMLLAVTNQLCQDIASVPFLWILPLLLYLATFIIAFGGEGAYRRGWAVGGLLVAIAVSCWVLLTVEVRGLLTQVVVYSALLFFGCLVFHGELYRSKPQAGYLTLFYVMLSVGGAVGGLFVCLVAPVVFLGFWELHLVIVGSLVVIGLALWRHQRAATEAAGGRSRAALLGMVLAVLAASGVLGWDIVSHLANDVSTYRNFYGVLHVRDSTSRPGRLYYLFHGRTVHGCQIRDADMRAAPTLYYTRGSGIGLAMQAHPRRNRATSDDPFQVGTVGMGIGTLAAYARAGELHRYYEIDPTMEQIARGDYFSYLEDAEARGAGVEVLIGDGRTVLEEELAATGGHGFDILVLDAFNAGSIPMHLLTREAFALYSQHLKPDGILAVHISNRHLDLKPVLQQAALDSGATALWISSSDKAGPVASAADWVLLSADPAFVEAARQHPAYRPMPTETVLWSDTYSHLISVLK